MRRFVTRWGWLLSIAVGAATLLDQDPSDRAVMVAQVVGWAVLCAALVSIAVRHRGAGRSAARSETADS